MGGKARQGKARPWRRPGHATTVFSSLSDVSLFLDNIPLTTATVDIHLKHTTSRQTKTLSTDLHHPT